MANEYSKENVWKIMEDSRTVNFIRAIGLPDRKNIRIDIETYTAIDGEASQELVDELHILRQDMTRRTAKTLKKLDVTAEELKCGLSDEKAVKQVSEYLHKYDGVIVSYGTCAVISDINKIAMEFQIPLVENNQFDMKKMTKKCDEDYPDKSTIENTREALKYCLKKYKKIYAAENNKKACTLNYAYYTEFDTVRMYNEWICCNTSIGNIYYDTLSEEWGMTKKESKKVGFSIESVDTEDVKDQLLKKYYVKNMEELKEKLKIRFELKEQQKSGISA